MAGEVAAVDDAVELGEHVLHAQVLLQAHAQAGHHVAHEQGRGQAVPAGIADGEAHQVLAQVDDVAEVPAHLLHRDRLVGHVEAGHLRRRFAQQALLDLRDLPEAEAHALLEEVQAEGRAQDVEREVHALAVPAPVQAEEEETTMRPAPHDHARGRALGQDAERGRRVRLARVREDVHAVAQDGGDGRPRPFQELGQRFEALAHAPAQLEAVAPLAVDEDPAQAEVLLHRVEDFFYEIVRLLAAGAVALEAIEQGVKAERNGARLRTNEGVFHVWAEKSKLREMSSAGASQYAARPGKIDLRVLRSARSPACARSQATTAAVAPREPRR